MKSVALSLVSLVVLSACAGNGEWGDQCERNYSVNGRELSECKNKVEAGRSVDLKPGQVSIDEKGTELQPLDQIGKDRDADFLDN